MIFCKYQMHLHPLFVPDAILPRQLFLLSRLKSIFSYILFYGKHGQRYESPTYSTMSATTLIMVSFYHDFVRITISRFSIFRLSFRIFSRNLRYHSHQALYCKPNNSFSVFKTMLYQGSIITLLLYFYLFI